MSRKTFHIRPLPLSIAALAVAGLLAAAPLVAQPQAAAGPGHGPGPGRHMGAGGDHHGMSGFFGGRGFARLARHLELTEEQRTQAQAIHQATREQVQPIRERSMELHGQLRELLEQPAPDATAVGELTIAVHANRDQVRRLHTDARASFEAILTAEQLAKLGELEERRDERRGRRGERGERGDWGKGKGKGRGAGGGLS